MQDLETRLDSQMEAREEAERQLKDVQHQLQQEKARMQLKEEAFARDRHMWESQEDAFKKRISQLEWNEELYNTLQVEKDVKDRELSEWKEAFDELEKERDEAVRKACEQERKVMKDENDAVQSFLGKVLAENDLLEKKVQELEDLRNLQARLAEVEVDRDVFRKNVTLYREFFDFVRNNNCLNHQGHTQWGITTHKIKCIESSRDARVERASHASAPRSEYTHLVSQTRGRSRSHSASARDDRHSYIPRTWSDETVRTNGIAAALPPTLSSKIGSMRKPKPVIADNIEASSVPLGRLIKRVEDAERKQKHADELLLRELAKSKELEIRWKAICGKKDSDLAECRHKLARLQVEVSSKPACSQSSWPLSPSSGSPRKRLTNMGDLDSISAVSLDSSRRSSLEIEQGDNILADVALASGTIKSAEMDVRMKDLLTRVSVLEEENLLLSDDLAAAEELRRRSDFEKIAEKEEARSALHAYQNSHQDEKHRMKEAFDSEKAVIWEKYQEILRDNQRLQHEVDSAQPDTHGIQLALVKAVKAYQTLHTLVQDVTHDVQALLASYGQDDVAIGRTASGSKEGREIVPIRAPSISSTAGADDINKIIVTLGDLSGSLAKSRAQLQETKACLRAISSSIELEAGRPAVSTPAIEEDGEVAQVTVKLDWITENCVQVHELGRGSEGENKKSKSSARRQVAELQAREVEHMQLLQERQQEIDALHDNLTTLSAGNADLHRQLQRMQSSEQVCSHPGGLEAGIGTNGAQSSFGSSFSSVPGRSPLGSPLHSVVRVPGGLCRKCMSQLKAADVESALDMAIALGQAEQELNDRERQIYHLEYKIMELEDERSDTRKDTARCWVVDSKFDTLETQGSAGSRDLFDAVVMTKKMLTQLKQDVKRSCESIIYELDDISQVLGRTVESTQQSITFAKLSSLRGVYVAEPRPPSKEDVHSRIMAAKQRRLVRSPNSSPIAGRTSPLIGRMCWPEDQGDKQNMLAPSSPGLPHHDASSIFSSANVVKKHTDNQDKKHTDNQDDEAASTSPVSELMVLLEQQRSSPDASGPRKRESLKKTQAAEEGPAPSPPQDESNLKDEEPGASREEAVDAEQKRRVHVTIESANLATEETINPYILVNLERKGNVETSRKTTPGGAQVRRDARTGNFDVQWHEGFAFHSLEPEQKFSFTWFDSQDASSTRPRMKALAKMPASRIFSKLTQGILTPPSAPAGADPLKFVLSMSNQKNKAVGSISIAVKCVNNKGVT